MRILLVFLILLSSLVSPKPKVHKPLETDKFHFDVLEKYYEERIDLRQQYEAALKVKRSKIYRTLDEESKGRFLKKRLYHNAFLIYGIDNSMTVRDYNKKFFPKAAVIGVAKFRFVSVITKDELREFANYKVADVLVVRTFYNAKKNLYYYEMEFLYFQDPKTKRVSTTKSLNRIKMNLQEYFVHSSKAKALSIKEVEKTYSLATLEDFEDQQEKKKKAVAEQEAQNPKQPFQKNAQQATKDQKVNAKAQKNLSPEQKKAIKDKQKADKMKKVLFFSHYSGVWLDVDTGYIYEFLYTAPYDHEVVRSQYKSDFVTYLSTSYLAEQKALAEKQAKEEREREIKAEQERRKKAEQAQNAKNKKAKQGTDPQKNKQETPKPNKGELGEIGGAQPNSSDSAVNLPMGNDDKNKSKELEYKGKRGFKLEQETKNGQEQKSYIVTGVMKGRVDNTVKIETFNPAYRLKPRDVLIKFNTYNGKGFYVDINKNIKEVTVKPEPRKNYIALLLPNGEKKYLVHINAGVNARSIYKLYAEGGRALPKTERPNYFYDEKVKTFDVKRIYNEYPAIIVGISFLILAILG